MVDFGYNVWCDCRVMPLYLLKNSNFLDFRVQTLVFLDGWLAESLLSPMQAIAFRLL
jgi:hypothetical protein